jgi:hypothetical protein
MFEELDLGGQGIRGLSYVPALGAYLVIGGPASREPGPFDLWRWCTGARALRSLWPARSFIDSGADADESSVRGEAADREATATRALATPNLTPTAHVRPGAAHSVEEEVGEDENNDGNTQYPARHVFAHDDLLWDLSKTKGGPES